MRRVDGRRGPRRGECDRAGSGGGRVLSADHAPQTPQAPSEDVSAATRPNTEAGARRSTERVLGVVARPTRTWFGAELYGDAGQAPTIGFEGRSATRLPSSPLPAGCRDFDCCVSPALCTGFAVVAHPFLPRIEPALAADVDPPEDGTRRGHRRDGGRGAAEGARDALNTPGKPIDHPDLFSGRPDLLADLRTEMSVDGVDFVLYGERGVGKTSLWRVLLHGKRVQRHSASDTDDFVSIFLRVLASLGEQFTEDERTQLAEISSSIGTDKVASIRQAPIGGQRETGTPPRARPELRARPPRASRRGPGRRRHRRVPEHLQASRPDPDHRSREGVRRPRGRRENLHRRRCRLRR